MTTKNSKPFVMPGADPLEEEPAEKINMSFMEPTEEEKEALAAAEARKAAREQEEADEKARLEEEAKAKAAEEEAAKNAEEAEKNKKPVEETLTEEEKAEASRIEAERAEAAKKKQPMVPKTRLDEVLAKNRELAEQLAQERAARDAAKPKPKEGEQPPKPFDFEAAEKEYMQAVRDGEDDKALGIRKQIRDAERKAVAQTTEESSDQQSAAVALARAAKIIEESFPQFTQGHEKFNAAATQEVVEMRDAMIMQGKNPVEALQRAVKFVVKEYGFDEALESSSNVVQLDEEKKKKETAKKIAAAKATPPDVVGEGNRTKKDEKNDAAAMTEEEFNALPEATKRRMRGDFI